MSIYVYQVSSSFTKTQSLPIAVAAGVKTVDIAFSSIANSSDGWKFIVLHYSGDTVNDFVRHKLEINYLLNGSETALTNITLVDENYKGFGDLAAGDPLTCAVSIHDDTMIRLTITNPGDPVSLTVSIRDAL